MLPQKLESISAAKRTTDEPIDKVLVSSVPQISDSVRVAANAGPTLLDSCGWTTGDYLVVDAWEFSADMTWGDEVPLEVQQREPVYVSKIDTHGWAKAASASSGKSGWLPASLLKRQVHVASLSSRVTLPGYMIVQVFDRLAVFHRERKWAYGAKVKKSRVGAASEEQVLEEGWFLSSCTE